MKRPNVLEALENLTLVKFTPDRDGAGAKATIRLHRDDRETQVWWRDPPKGQPLILHFRPYPAGWTELSLAEQREATKATAVAIATHNAKTQKG